MSASLLPLQQKGLELLRGKRDFDQKVVSLSPRETSEPRWELKPHH